MWLLVILKVGPATFGLSGQYIRHFSSKSQGRVTGKIGRLVHVVFFFWSGLGDILACWWDRAGAVLAGSKWPVRERDVERMLGFSYVVEVGQCPCSDEDTVWDRDVHRVEF
jgi:hypothetical protein